MLLAIAPGVPLHHNGLNWEDYEEGEEHGDVGDHLCPIVSNVPSKNDGELVERVASEQERNGAEQEANILAPFGYGLLSKLVDLAFKVRS